MKDAWDSFQVFRQCSLIKIGTWSLGCSKDLANYSGSSYFIFHALWLNLNGPEK